MRALIGTLLFLMLASPASAKTPYVLAILPDTQTACRAGDLDWPQLMVQYIVDQKAAYIADPADGRNIIAIVGVGDVTDDIGAVGLCGIDLIVDWKAAFTDIAFAASMPVVVSMGNHDLDPVNAITIASADLWRTYFSSSFWDGKSYFNGCANEAEGTRYGADTNCSFSIPTGNGTDNLHVISTEWHDYSSFPSSDTLTAARAWILATAREHSDEPLIVSTHDHMLTNPVLNDNPQRCFKPAVADYWTSSTSLPSLRQFFAIISGHSVGGQGGYDTESHNGSEDDFNWSCYLLGTNAWGNTYISEMRNYQRIESFPAEGSGSGDGLIWFMEIDEDTGCISSESCSPDTIGNYCRDSFRETYTICGFDFSIRPPIGVPSLSPPLLAVLCLVLGGIALLLPVARRSRN